MRKETYAPRLRGVDAVVLARSLRKSMTPAERALWQELRRASLEGSHFRRQTPIGPYIVDFACRAARLVVEVDGNA
ncbi:MAG: endonuclease domain-containing protein, partial [Caulobacteraceae bacterium]